MTATAALRVPATRPLPALQLSAEETHPTTKPLQTLAPATGNEPPITARLPRKDNGGLVLTGTVSRPGLRYAWLIDATASPLGPTATAAVLADLQEMLRRELATATVHETLRAAHRHLLRTASTRAVPFSIALVREAAGVLETAVLGTATVKLRERTGRTRTVVCHRPHRRALEVIGIGVDVATDPRTGRPAEVEVHRAPRPPRHPVPVLGADTRSPGRAGYGVSASHLLESVQLRAGRRANR